MSAAVQSFSIREIGNATYGVNLEWISLVPLLCKIAFVSLFCNDLIMLYMKRTLYWHCHCILRHYIEFHTKFKQIQIQQNSTKYHYVMRNLYVSDFAPQFHYFGFGTETLSVHKIKSTVKYCEAVLYDRYQFYFEQHTFQQFEANTNLGAEMQCTGLQYRTSAIY
ncbi:hypothetical protein T01_15664 [Trichinella spiralis]|uniref:Uncharacterized protein n=1 Tax=Trichinella spiralis TaxID=6334 RepID=A0A0V1BIV5_TRISP|nr:hypothetical protein T01_15664 [Trichinella spiralis]